MDFKFSVKLPGEGTQVIYQGIRARVLVRNFGPVVTELNYDTETTKLSPGSAAMVEAKCVKAFGSGCELEVHIECSDPIPDK